MEEPRERLRVPTERADRRACSGLERLDERQEARLRAHDADADALAVALEMVGPVEEPREPGRGHLPRAHEDPVRLGPPAPHVEERAEVLARGAVEPRAAPALDDQETQVR